VTEWRIPKCWISRKTTGTTWATRVVDEMRWYVRYAFRTLTRNKSFAAVAILALALGIGPNVAIFSMIWAVFLVPLPYPHADRIVSSQVFLKGEPAPLFAEDFAQIQANAKSFDALQFTSWIPLHLTNPDHSQAQELGSSVTTSGVLAVPIVMGRDFLPDDGGPGKDHVVIINHALWVNRFHSDHNVIGKLILINDEPYTVIGVWAAGVKDRILESSFAVPLKFVPGVRYPYWGSFVGRLKAGVTIAQAQAELSTLQQQILAANGGDARHWWSVTVTPFRNAALDHNLERNLWLSFAAVALVLCIACVNVANLLLVRITARRQELAVRSALGANRLRVSVQLITESLTLAVLGGILGIGLGWVTMNVGKAKLPQVPAEVNIALNVPVLLFALVATILSGLFFGCASAWYAARLNLSETLKQGVRSRTGRSRVHTQSSLVAAEFALALTLLSGAGMAMHSLWNLSRIDIGIRTDHVITGVLSPRGPGVTSLSPEEALINARQSLDTIRAVPGVEDAGLSMEIPLQVQAKVSFTIAGRPVSPADKPISQMEDVTPGYFTTLGIRMLRGRFFNEGDNLASPPVALVNETFVRRFLSGSDPLGQRLLLPILRGVQQPGPPVPHQIVGVIHDVANGRHLTDKPMSAIYIPFYQNPFPYFDLGVWTKIDPGYVASNLRSVLDRTDPMLKLSNLQIFQHYIDDQFTSDRFILALFGAFAAVALLLAALGIYGVMAFAVVQRTREIGIRMALGAQRDEVVHLILRDGLQMMTAGMAIGLAGVYVLGRLMHSTLFGVGSVDYPSFALVAVLLFAVAILSSWIPARRSARVDPMVALREE
jgi:putative ABC transport system permease protein